ncbi:hypothetical protein V5O39_07980 [Pseudomonas parakoreensis]
MIRRDIYPLANTVTLHAVSRVRPWHTDIHTRLVQAGASAAEIQHDIAECQYQANAATASYHSTPAANDKTHGMGSAVGDGIIIAEKQIDLKNDCMQGNVYLRQ